MPRWSAVPPLCVCLKFNVVTMNMYDLVHLGESRVVYQILRGIYDQIGDAESELGEYQDITAPTYVHTENPRRQCGRGQIDTVLRISGAPPG